MFYGAQATNWQRIGWKSNAYSG